MRKKWIVAAVILLVVIAAAFLVVSRKSRLPVTAEPYKNIDKEAGALYEESERLLREGDLLDAKRAYEKLLAEYPESGLVERARAELDDLNMRILFSPVPTEDSVFYEVKPGDTLSKIAGEHGTTVGLIMKSNDLKDSLITPGMRLKISKAKYNILIDKSQNILMLKAGDEVLKTYSVSTGKDNVTPVGTHLIINKLVNPTWYKTGAIIPPDSPENLLGSRWMGLTADAYGIHGTTDESTIGTQITNGCIRMRNRDVEELYSIVPVGTEVTIID